MLDFIIEICQAELGDYEKSKRKTKKQKTKRKIE
jgi:hypothetical protein